MTDYNRLCSERNEIISRNRSRRMKRLPALSVPPKPVPPMGYEIYVDGDWNGFYPHDNQVGALDCAQSISDGGAIKVKRCPRKY